jgi:hypothetical protein
MEWLPIETCPPVNERPKRCFVRVEGRKDSVPGPEGRRVWCTLVYTDPETDSVTGFRRSELSHIFKDGDMDGYQFTHWMPAIFPDVTP